MPSAGEALDDDYVIQLLQKDAAANQKRYLSSGLGSLLSRRPRGTAPKPNTRFLKNLVQEADSHNAALKAKEEEESQARLREVVEKSSGGKRRRGDEDHEGSAKRRRGEEKAGRWASALEGMGREGKRREGASRAVDGRRAAESASRVPSRRKRRAEAREKDRGNGGGGQVHERRRPSSRSSSPSHRKERRRIPTPSDNNDSRHRRQNDSDSDPLEDIIGPKPPPKDRPRGRGVLKSSAENMDARFAPSYNPKADVSLEPDEDRDDWDMALEALRDRAKWRAQGGDRLRAAGFTDEEIQKWEEGGEKDVDDVKWRKKGEGREWDRGKVVDEAAGSVELRPEWGRLKGS